MALNTINKKNNNMSSSSWITQYDSLVIFGGFGIAILGTIVFTGLFHAGDTIRTNVLFNFICGFLMTILFIWLIFKYMGSEIVIFGKHFDIGMIVYIFIILFIIFVFGN